MSRIEIRTRKKKKKKRKPYVKGARRAHKTDWLTLSEAVTAGIELTGIEEVLMSKPVTDFYSQEEIDSKLNLERGMGFLVGKGKRPYMYLAEPPFNGVWVDSFKYRKFLKDNKLVSNVTRKNIEADLKRYARKGRKWRNGNNDIRALMLARKPIDVDLLHREKPTGKQLRVITFRPADETEVRNIADLYPTPGEASQVLIDFLKLPRNVTIYEPACGFGHMAKAWQMNGYKVVASDLFDYGYGEPGLNFIYSSFKDYDWLITNPPFSLAHDFIEKAYANGKPFALLLKQQFWNAGERRELFLQTRPTHFLPLTWRVNFKHNPKHNKSTMDTAWVIWGPDSFNRAKPLFTDFYPLKRPTNYPKFNARGELIEPFTKDI